MKRNRQTREQATLKKWRLSLRPLRLRTITVTLRRPTAHDAVEWLRGMTKQRVRVGFAVIVAVLLFTEIIPLWQPHIKAKSYDFGDASSLLSAPSKALAQKIHFDDKNQAYNFNENFKPGVTGIAGAGGAQISAVAHADASKGITVTDPVANVDLGMKPTFALEAGSQKDNRIVYPLRDGTGWLVYTMESGQVKEDVLLKHANGNTMELSYDLDLGDGLAARLTPKGDIGVYGSSLPITGNVTTGNEKDAQLLQKARAKATKDKLLFVIPAPVVKENNVTKSSVSAAYELHGNQLKVHVSGLKNATYPLTIDPSIYVTSAQQFMQGNNESNIDFNVPSDLIQKGSLTGARIPSWASTVNLNTAVSGQGTAVGGGYIYTVGGNNGTSNVSTVTWAKFSTTDDTIVSPNAAICTTFCNNSAYNLPVARTGLSVTVYNGYLYAVGGSDTTDPTCSNTGNVCTSVYYAKISANGEPISWTLASNSLTAPNGGTGVKFASLAAYNNRLYLVGGQSSATPAGIQNVQSAGVNPDGSITAWSSYTTIPTAGRWGHTTLTYNGYLYLIGGASGTTTQNSVQYAKINADGTIASWVTTTAFATGRASLGGTFATIYGGYMYVAGACSAVTATGCTTILSDLQLASLNGDGSVTNWATQTGITQARTAYGLTSWRGALYAVGGCTTAACTTPSSAITYGSINSDGDISVKISTPGANSGTAATNCLNTADTTTNCDLPPVGTGTGNGGRLAGGVVINNGYIYYIGGCRINDCSSMSQRTSYSAIASNGSLTSPAACTGGVRYNNWCVDPATLNGTTGLGGIGVTVFNNTLYAYGGSTGNAFQTSLYYIGTTASGALANTTWTAVTTANSGLPTTATASSFIFARATSTVTTNTFAGNIYIAGGCTGNATGAGIGCTGYVSTVYKCNILATGAIYSGATTASRCTTTGQLQIDGDATTAGSQGLGISAGSVYGNYVYLAGGASGTGVTQAQQKYVFYAEIDANNNIVDPTSGHTTWPFTTTDAAATGTTPSLMTLPRRRATAYATNGYLYVIAGHDGSAGNPGDTLQDIQIGKIDQATGNILSFTQLKDNSGSVNIISERWNLAASGANGYIYMIGGCTGGGTNSYPPANCSGTSNNTGGTDGMNGKVEYVQVYNNYSGSPAGYGVGTNPTDRTEAGTVVKNGYIYVAGGCTVPTSADCGNAASHTNDVSYAPIAADGTISATWTAGATLPAARSGGCLVASGNTLYYIGGESANTAGNNALNTVYYSDISSGAPAAWATATPITANRAGLSCAVYSGKVYVTGGYDGTAYTNTVYMSSDVTSGGNITSWTTQNAFTTGRNGQVTIAYGNNLYVMGGFDGTSYLSDVQYALINNNGTIGSWSNAPSLPQQVRQGAGFGANGYIYVFGGRSAATTCTSNTYVVPVNANPIVNKVVQANPSPLGGWSQTSVAFNTARYGAAAAYDGGRAYVFGGSCNAALTGANRVTYSTLQSQPQIATYSLKIDADTDVFPSKFLMNGTDTGIGARWFFKYQSATFASSTYTNNAWGTSTNFGAVTLGTPGAYAPLSTTGVNSLSARWYYLVVTVDASQSFGYPEDSARGPTIEDITLQFSSDPSKRLRNGKTFTGGLQQPLDTPF